MSELWLPTAWSNKPRADVPDGSQSVFTRLTQRFRLTDSYPPSPIPSQLMKVSKTVIPVTDMDKLLRVFSVVTITGISVTATGLVDVDQVPISKRRTVHAIRATQVTGTFTMDQFRVAQVAGSGVPIKVVTAATDIFFFPADMAVELEGGWFLEVNVATKAVNGTMNISQYYCEEDAY